MLKRTFVGAVLSAGLLIGGQGGTGTSAGILPGEPNPGQGIPNKELREFLTLTEAQNLALEAIQRQRWEAEATQWRTITQKETELYQLLNGGSSDAFRVGQLMIEIQNLRKQVIQPPGTYKQQALQVLNPQQTAKLSGLVTALDLQSPAWQAVGLNLLDPPKRDSGIIPAGTPNRAAEVGAFNAPRLER